MNFEQLHELVRAELARRIERGDLTGVELARRSGFKQAHISNFLNGRRALSMNGLDRVLAAQGLTVDRLLPLDLNASAGCVPAGPGAGDGSAAECVEWVPVVPSPAAIEDAALRPGTMMDAVPVAPGKLAACRARTTERRAGWRRFVAVRADAHQAAAMQPMIVPGAAVVIDRHYNSLAPYRVNHRTLYAVRAGGGLVLRFVEFEEGRLVLRPLALDFPIELVTPGALESPADYLVGRVCLVLAEL